MKITGTHFNYYFICHRKLWLFLHGIECEMESDAVRMGKHIHETSYEKEQKEIDIDGTIVLDWFDAKKQLVHEVKKSDKMEEAHQWQILYYLWFLKQKGLMVAATENEEGIKGELNYPTLRTKKSVILTKEKELQLTDRILPDIENIAQQETIPSTVEWKVCRSCSYCELCHG
jgi:CRISPR-associated exonuclease Cas4